MANGGSLIPIKSAGCGQLALGFYQIGRLENEYGIKPFDIVFFNWDGGQTPSSYVPFPSVDHVGIVESVGSNGDFVAIEGNTGGSRNGEVMRRNRNIKDVSCVAHPKYTKEITGNMIIETARKEIGTVATNIKVCKYNTWYYGMEVSGDCYDWCAAFVCWVFYHTESGSGLKRQDNKISLRTCGEGYEMREGQIKNIQRILYMCGYTARNGTKLGVSGKWDEDTIYAVNSWLKKHGYKQDGRLGPVCLKEFYSGD